MKTVLLTGPSGSVGYQTLLKLIEQKDRFNIRLLDIKTRRNFKKLKIFKNQTEIIWGDICSRKTCKEAVSNVDYIIHTAAIIPPKADEFTDLANRVNFGGTKKLTDSILQHNPRIFLIYTSSISVYGDRINKPQITVFDNLFPSPGDHYALTKIKAENYIKRNLCNFTIFRLSAVMDIRMKIDPLFFHMPLNTPLEIVTSSDVATALVNALDYQLYLNERIFNVGGGETCRIRYDTFLQRNFKLFGLEKPDFPKQAFADKNFHCAYYKDSSQLNRILNYQQNSIDDYLKEVAENIHPMKKYFTKLFRKIIFKHLLKKSVPYKAYIEGNISSLKHFFNSETFNYT